MIGDLVWARGVEPLGLGRGDDLVAQCSAHGQPRPVAVEPGPGPARRRLRWIGSAASPGWRRARAWCVYHDDLVVGGGIAR